MELAHDAEGMKMRECQSIIEAARAHIAGCIGEAAPEDAFNCWNVGDLPTIPTPLMRGIDSDTIRKRLADEIRRQLAARRLV
jgi:hypothetical protein